MITLATLAKNADNKLVQGFINEVITDSALLDRMQFDNCVEANGSTLVYGYKRVTGGLTAAFRDLNAEPAASDLAFDRVTTTLAILSDKWSMDRVAQAAAPDLYEQYLTESKNAIVRAFTKEFINGAPKAAAGGDPAVLGFEGMAKLLAGGATEKTAAADISTVTQASALAFAEDLDGMLSSLMRQPDLLMVSSATKVKINAVCRALGLGTTTADSAGHQVASWNGIQIEEVHDPAVCGTDIYALCLGMDAVHGVTLKGDSAVTVSVPDWSAPGAVKSGDAEFVCGVALKNTRAAGVLHQKAASAGGSGSGK